MSQDNQFHQYGYDHYLKAPTRPRPNARFVGGMRDNILNKAQSPAIATVALVAAAALFIGVIAITYPSGEEGEKHIPIVKADLRPVKSFPDDRGGMDIPHRDSTILARPSAAALSSERQEIENLFSRTSENFVSKEQAIEQAMAEHPMDVAEVPLISGETPSSLLHEQGQEPIRSENDLEIAVSDSRSLSMQTISSPEIVASKNTSDVLPGFELKEPTAKNILQKIGSSDGESKIDESGFSVKVASAAMLKKPFKPKMHAAATSPETLEFVRGILNDKENKVSGKSHPSKIEPAVGASSTSNIISGAYFVQLASITDPARAGKEWSKMQTLYNALAKSKFRVQEAVLSSGTFYRIQAGPMSKYDANNVCESLKRENKPGGCLVVK